MRTILAIADVTEPAGNADHVEETLLAQRDWLFGHGYTIRCVAYDDVVRRALDPLPATAAILFFPHRHWEQEVEGQVDALYGTREYGRRIRHHLTEADQVLRSVAPSIRYLNDPRAVADTRDKQEVKRRWLAAGVPTPAPVTARTPAELRAAVDRLGCVYVKAPSASMNKGIIMLSHDRWTTNYVFRDGVLAAPDDGDPQYQGPDSWDFADIEVGDETFLSAILAVPDFVMEEGFTRAAIGDTRIELRVTVLGGRVIDTRVHTAVDGAATTAGDGTAPPTVPQATLDRAHTVAVRAAATLDLDYAVLDVVLDEHQNPHVIDAQAFPALGTSPEIFRQMLTALLGNEGPVPESLTIGRAADARPATEGASCRHWMSSSVN